MKRPAPGKQRRSVAPNKKRGSAAPNKQRGSAAPDKQRDSVAPAMRRARPATSGAAAAGTGAARSGETRTGADPAGLRIGCGADVHPLAPGRRLVLGGVSIPHERGLLGHSDADVLAHAVCDAILGALGLPDMGSRFPATDESLRGRSSLLFLGEVIEEARGRGFDIVNLDSVVLAEAPRLSAHLETMRANLADALGCPASCVGVKAKRFEGLGAVGRREGIMAQAVVLLGPKGGRR